MGPKQRKSLSSISTQSYANSPWKSLTRAELYEVLDCCDIPISSEKLLKGEIIEILERNLSEAECKKWLEHYNKDFPPSFNKLDYPEKVDFITESPKKGKVVKGRQSVPAYIAVANQNSDTIFSKTFQNKDRTSNNTSRTRNSISGIYNLKSQAENDVTAQITSGDLDLKIQSFCSKSSVLSEEKNSVIINDKKEFYEFTNKQNHSNLLNTTRISIKKAFVIVIFIIVTFFVYNRLKIFIKDPKFCDTNYLFDNKNSHKSNSCVLCPNNGHCENGILTCNQQFKKEIKYIKNKWQILCVYDDEAFELSEEMLSYISKKLRKMKGKKNCSNTNIVNLISKDINDTDDDTFDISTNMSESEINNLIYLSFGYIERDVINNALSIMWSSIKNGKSLSKYRLKSRNINNLELHNNVPQGEPDKVEYNESTLYIEAIDSETSVICSAKFIIQKWTIISSLIIGTIIPLYIFFSRIRRKYIVMNKIKEIIIRENRKDTVSGLFIGPDASTISRLLHKELPQYKGNLSEDVVTQYCDELEKNDKSIQKTVFSNSKMPFYWVLN
ncbi:cysteine rich protein [Cryptosporidium ryanae]|uniref:cysteine rich protein n=1 Tax=Cryptosporidium ryanae TaxID=515981 RepID=UPI00351A5122|nr:cysteine rich protein [Cryptosporidium ryanae]